jgi:WD40 repeat protein
MAISQDGKQLYIVGDGGTVACMDTTTGKLRTGSRLGQAWSIAVSPDGRRLAVGLMGNIAVLDAQSLRTIVTLRRHRGPVMSMSFSSDGNRLASVSTDKTLRVFDLQKAIDEQSQQ